MLSIPILAGLFTAFAWGLAPVIAKRGFTYGGSPRYGALLFITTGMVLFWGVLAVTRGPFSMAPTLTPLGFGVFIAGGVLGTALGRLSAFSGLDRVGASVNTAVLSINPLVATVLAYLLLGERISLPQALGIVIVVGGLFVLSISQAGDRSGWTTRDLLFPLAAAVAFGTGAVIRRYGLTETTATAVDGVALNETAAFVVIVGYLLARRRVIIEPIPLRGYAYFVGAGLVSALGLLSLFTGLQQGRVAIVATLAGTATLFATFFSYLLLGDLERITGRFLTGAALVVVGTALLSLF